jgi:hypothetical protein
LPAVGVPVVPKLFGVPDVSCALLFQAPLLLQASLL